MSWTGSEEIDAIPWSGCSFSFIPNCQAALSRLHNAHICMFPALLFRVAKEKHDSLSLDERIRRKRADLYQRSRKKEPLEAELVVLFGSVAVILIIPWVIHDYRFIFILPAIVFAVPGLRGVVFQAAVEIYDYFATQRSARMTQRVRNKGGTAESDGSRRRYATMRRAREVVDNQRADDSTTVRKTQKTRRTYHPSRQQSSTKQHRVSNKSARLSRNRDDDALIRVVKRLPLLRDWGGFL
ncbi:hypothetical protein PSENEW3_00006021 [Picochlorum sp. SENEW3]|nr:hypothetical protein PSENEW3_00006021 [Picochlorum sp. SENEW3]